MALVPIQINPQGRLCMGVAVNPPTMEEVILATSPTHYWPTQEVGGGTAVDVVGGANAGVGAGTTLGNVNAAFGDQLAARNTSTSTSQLKTANLDIFQGGETQFALHFMFDSETGNDGSWQDTQFQWIVMRDGGGSVSGTAITAGWNLASGCGARPTFSFVMYDGIFTGGSDSWRNNISLAYTLTAGSVPPTEPYFEQCTRAIDVVVNVDLAAATDVVKLYWNGQRKLDALGGNLNGANPIPIGQRSFRKVSLAGTPPPDGWPVGMGANEGGYNAPIGYHGQWGLWAGKNLTEQEIIDIAAFIP